VRNQKLEIVEKYGAAYTKAFANARNLKKYYIDGFSGPGVHVSKRTKAPIEGSPARALKIAPPFDAFYFIDLNADKTDYLRAICGNRSDVHIHTGDCNEYLTRSLLPTIHYKKFNRALCLLDPYGLDLDWEVILQAGQSGAVDMFLNFPVMDMNRNAIWRDPDKAPAGGVDRMNKFWGDDSWRDAVYAEPRQRSFFGPELVEARQRGDRCLLPGAIKESGRLWLCPQAAADAQQQKSRCVLPVFCVAERRRPKDHHRHFPQL
jgi:three-Cys-motif partner protein